jgi:hypothetical protein
VNGKYNPYWDLVSKQEERQWIPEREQKRRDHRVGWRLHEDLEIRI